MKLRVSAVSDLHGQFPERIPNCDLFIVAGDIVPDRKECPTPEHQAVWLKKEFGPWLHSMRYSFNRAVLTWGNHDAVGVLLSEAPEIWMPMSQREYVEVCVDRLSRHARAMGARVWCSPWSLRFYDWPWMESDSKLEDIYAYIPENLDILVAHGPPQHYCDRNMHGDRCGSEALHDRIRHLADVGGAPKHLVCGHIHEGRGTDRIEDTFVWNVSAFKTAHPLYMVNDPVVSFDVEVGR